VGLLCAGLGRLGRGGRLVYSTCSLNPVENEAVCAAALRACAAAAAATGRMRISMLPPAAALPAAAPRGRPALAAWAVPDADFCRTGRLYRRWADVPAARRSTLAPSMFPPEPAGAGPAAEGEAWVRAQVQLGMRVLPADGSSGFFLALFQRDSDGDSDDDSDGTGSGPGDSGGGEDGALLPALADCDPAGLQQLVRFFGLAGEGGDGDGDGDGGAEQCGGDAAPRPAERGGWGLRQLVVASRAGGGALVSLASPALCRLRRPAGGAAAAELVAAGAPLVHRLGPAAAAALAGGGGGAGYGAGAAAWRVCQEGAALLAGRARRRVVRVEAGALAGLLGRRHVAAAELRAMQRRGAAAGLETCGPADCREGAGGGGDDYDGGGGGGALEDGGVVVAPLRRTCAAGCSGLGDGAAVVGGGGTLAGPFLAAVIHTTPGGGGGGGGEQRVVWLAGDAALRRCAAALRHLPAEAV
jgi:hypothetical protein